MVNARLLRTKYLAVNKVAPSLAIVLRRNDAKSV